MRYKGVGAASWRLRSGSLVKPRTPPGTLELLPHEQLKFQQMLSVIRSTYERFGFLPVETPAFELTDVLLTKTGGETEQQVYFVQSTGAHQNYTAAVQGGEEPGLPELALRFDLTVPIARYVAEHEHKLTFPFRRYQMQRVYRGERAQRGRFREFYQCDIDIINKDELSIRYDAEILAVIYAVFTELAIGEFQVQLNNRKLLRGFLHSVGVTAQELQELVLREVDKLDKQGEAKVRAALTGPKVGLSEEATTKILTLAASRSSSLAHALELLSELTASAPDDESGELLQGIEELREVLRLVQAMGVPEGAYRLNLGIARGLDYYTGTVYETELVEHKEIGSICSGGRYDDLASHYTRSRLPGVGISIGLSRLFWQLRDAGLLKEGATSSVQVMVALLADELLEEALGLATLLRGAGLNTEVQLESRRVGRQLQYAARAGIRFVVLLGESELKRDVVGLKDLQSGEQTEVARADLAGTVTALLQAKP